MSAYYCGEHPFRHQYGPSPLMKACETWLACRAALAAVNEQLRYSAPLMIGELFRRQAAEARDT